MLGTRKPFSELTGRGKLIEVLRWLCVLPAAVLVDNATQFAVDAAVQIASYVGLGILRDSIIVYFLSVLLDYVLPKSAFVVAGAKMAPRYQRATAIVLALLGFSFSLMTHVISQHLAGRRLGIHNYTHLFAETAGVLGGAAYMSLEFWRIRRTAGTA
jgi:hypothetical protein